MRFYPSLICAMFAVAASAQDLLEISDHGQRQRFETARDELFTTSPDGRRQLTRIPAQASLSSVKREADRLRRTQGGEAQIVLYEAGRPHDAATRRLLTRRALVVAAPGTDIPALAAQAGAVTFTRAPALENAWIFHAAGSGGALDIASRLGQRRDVVHVEPLLARQQFKRLVPGDPLFTNQWHLANRGQNSGTVGVDVRVTNAWNTFRGEGIRIGIVDDGLQYTHPDLTNCDLATSHDFADDDSDPAPSITNEDFHGSACAGVAAACGSNGIGVVGAAYRARTVGVRLIAYPTTDEQEAEAMAYSNDVIEIKSNSWGPIDDGSTLQAPGLLARAAIEDAVANGRGGKGTIFVWAGGNGGTNDNSNKDGYANMMETIAISAINDRGLRCDYSEKGANIVAGTPSGDSFVGRQDITTTDLVGNDGYNTNNTAGEYSDRNYTKFFSGTSSACPLAAGVIALILQSNTNLGWRDVQEIIIRTATKNNTGSAEWTNNAAGFHFNHQYGAGLMNATSAINAALTWTNLGPQMSVSISQSNFNAAIPDNNTGGVTQKFDAASVAMRVEFVTVTVDIDHTRRGDVNIVVTSPSGMQSIMIPNTADTASDYKLWTFMSVRHWGESAAGVWTVRTTDRRNGQTGAVRSTTLSLYGTPSSGTAPYPIFVANAASDGAGNSNGDLDPGEIIEERVSLRNVGATATNVSLVISTTNEQVFMMSSNAALSLLAPSAPVTNGAPFIFRLSKDIPCGAVVPFNLVATYAGGALTAQFSHVVGTTYASDSTTTTFTATDVPRAIPDGLGVAMSTIVIAQADSPIIDDINVGIRINHPFDGDLQFAARHADGTEVLLSNQNGYTNDNFGSGASCGAATYTVFDDEAENFMLDGNPPYAGSFKPDSWLTSFDGKPLNGAWRLRVNDLYSGDTGTVICWSVTATYHTETNSCSIFNNAPTASNLLVATTSTLPVLIQLAGSDADGEVISFMTNLPPQRGALTGFSPVTGQVMYTPTNSLSGTDTFTYATSDGFTNSQPATVTIEIAGAPPCTDCDSDGIDDTWEQAFFTNLTTVTATSDSDGDGFSDLNEFYAGSLPNNTNSLLKETAVSAPVSGGFLVTWQSHTGRYYIVSRSTNLLAQFVGIATNIFATPPVNVYTDTVVAPIQHYRVEGKNGPF